MAGEEKVDLRVYFERRLDDLEARLQERYETQTKAIEAAFTAQQTAMQTAFTAADKAVDKALAAAEKAVDQRATTLDREFHEHLEQVRHENALAFVNSDKAVNAALTSAKEAVTKAEAAAEKRFEGVNEFRRTLSDQAALFLPRTEYHQAHVNLEDRVQDITDRLNRSEGTGFGTRQARAEQRLDSGQLVAIVSTILAAIAIAVTLILALNG